MAHPLTHLTHGIPTRRPFHPAKTASERCASPKRESIQVAVFFATIQTVPPTRNCRMLHRSG